MFTVWSVLLNISGYSVAAREKSLLQQFFRVFIGIDFRRIPVGGKIAVESYPECKVVLNNLSYCSLLYF